MDESNKVKKLLIENASFTIEADKNVSGRITIYAEKNNMIFGSMRFLGFEVARLKLTDDSLFFINRLNREFLYTDIESLGNIYGFDLKYKTLENIIFTGFPDPPKGKSHEFYSLASQANDTVRFPYQLSTVNKLNSEYSFPGMDLIKLDYSDLPSMVRANVLVNRNGNEISTIEGMIQKELFLAKFKFEIGNISNKKYSKTKFRIGRNYKEASIIF